MPSTVVWSTFRKHGVKLATVGWLRCTRLTMTFLNVSHSDRRSAIPIGINSYWAQGLKPPTFMIMGLAYMTSPPTFVT